jgi:hypothetical protein
MSKVESKQLVKDILSFAKSAIIALVDGQISAEELVILIPKGKAIVAALEALIKKDDE